MIKFIRELMLICTGLNLAIFTMAVSVSDNDMGLFSAVCAALCLAGYQTLGKKGE